MAIKRIESVRMEQSAGSKGEAVLSRSMEGNVRLCSGNEILDLPFSFPFHERTFKARCLKHVFGPH